MARSNGDPRSNKSSRIQRVPSPRKSRSKLVKKTTTRKPAKLQEPTMPTPQLPKRKRSYARVPESEDDEVETSHHAQKYRKSSSATPRVYAPTASRPIPSTPRHATTTQLKSPPSSTAEPEDSDGNDNDGREGGNGADVDECEDSVEEGDNDNDDEDRKIRRAGRAWYRVVGDSTYVPSEVFSQGPLLMKAFEEYEVECEELQESFVAQDIPESERIYPQFPLEDMRMLQIFSAVVGDSSPTSIQAVVKLIEQRERHDPTVDQEPLYRLMQEEARKARNCDSIKEIRDTALLLGEGGRPVRDFPGNKAARGWHSVPTATLLCPVTDIDEFERDPEKYMVDVVLQRKAAADDDGDSEDDNERHLALPSYLFDLTMLQNDKVKAFLKGPFLLRFFLHIFCGNGIPGKTGKKTKSPVCRIIGMTCVTAFMIGYVVAKLDFALSDEKEYEMTPGRCYLFWRVVDMIKQGSEGKNILEFWNSEWKECMADRHKHSKKKRQKTVVDCQDTKDLMMAMGMYVSPSRKGKETQANDGLDSFPSGDNDDSLTAASADVPVDLHSEDLSERILESRDQNVPSKLDDTGATAETKAKTKPKTSKALKRKKGKEPERLDSQLQSPPPSSQPAFIPVQVERNGHPLCYHDPACEADYVDVQLQYHCTCGALTVSLSVLLRFDFADIFCDVEITHVPDSGGYFEELKRERQDRAKNSACAACGSPHDLKACSACSQRFYCSSLCQKGHWKSTHKQECPTLKKQRKTSK